MSEKIDYRGNRMTTSFLTGGVLGAGIALLLAPKSGKELRKDVNRLAKDVNRFAANAGDRVAGAIEKGRDIAGEGAARITGAIEKGVTAFAEQKKKLTGLVRPKRSIVGPVLAGTLAGGVIALLLAPKAGKELRKDVKNFAGAAGDRVSSAVHKGKDLYEQGKAKVGEAVEAGRERLHEAFAA